MHEHAGPLFQSLEFPGRPAVGARPARPEPEPSAQLASLRGPGVPRPGRLQPTRSVRPVSAAGPPEPARRSLPPPRPGRPPGPRAEGNGEEERLEELEADTASASPVSAGGRRRREAEHSPHRRREAGGGTPPSAAAHRLTLPPPGGCGPGPAGQAGECCWPAYSARRRGRQGYPASRGGAAATRDRQRIPGKVKGGRGARGRPGGKVPGS